MLAPLAAPDLIGPLLPSGVVGYERTTLASDAETLLADRPAESHHVRGAVPIRRAEFATGRACARTALHALGLAEAVIAVGPRGEPLWPDGFVGSITHTRGYAAAAAAPARRWASLGIDAEPDAPMPDGVLRTIASPAELEHVAELTALDPTVAWDRLLFCAKEALFKAWYPLAHCWLDFTEAAIRFDPPAGGFRAELTRPVPPGFGGPMVPGRWRAASGFLITSVVVPTAR